MGQHRVRSGDVLLEKVAGADNQADCLTKYVSGPDLHKHVLNMGLEFEEGRASTAPQLTTSVSESLSREKEVIREERRRAKGHGGKEVMSTEATATVVTSSASVSYITCGGCQSKQPASTSQCPVCEAQCRPLPRPTCGK